ncbi:N-6 DNA methylase [Streptomyces canus]|uniref:N-6 DNA methylase n=1 Tax=Streptomyces canus TaxID=58343 RepID=UPI003805EA34
MDEVRVTRADIARFAGVKRPAVTNWERRHADFPGPLGEGAGGGAEVEVFRATDVLAWLERRAIPSNARHPDEPPGTTYGDRFRTALGEPAAPLLLKTVERLSGPEVERFRGGLSHADYVTVLLSLVYLRGCRPEEWGELTDHADRVRSGLPGQLLAYGLARAAGQSLGPTHGQTLRALAEEQGALLLSDTIRSLDGAGPVERADHAAAFEALLTRYSDLVGRTAGDFFTPRAAVDILAKLVADAPQEITSVHDPFVRAGELLSATLGEVLAGGGDSRVEATGNGVGDHPLVLAGMNLALHGWPDAGLVPGHSAPSADTRAARRTFDRILTNPPFNARTPETPSTRAHWRYGPPPTHNANYDWLQYAVASLAPSGLAAVLMPNIAAMSAHRGERHIRSLMVADGAVEAVIALPSHLFTSTSIPVMVWLLRHPTGSCDEVLFVDASGFGAMVSRVRREFSPQETAAIVQEVASWRAARAAGRPYPGTTGLSRSVPFEDIEKRDFTLSPVVYVSDDIPDFRPLTGAEQLTVLAGRLAAVQHRALAADAVVDELLRRYDL